MLFFHALVLEDHSLTEVVESKTRTHLTALEVGFLQLNFPELCKEIRLGTYKGSYANVVNKARLSVKTMTRFELLKGECPYAFDGPIVDARGQGNTVFQYAYKDSTVYCAKIGRANTVQREYDTGERVGRYYQFPSVMPVVALVPVPNDSCADRTALITPLYPASLERFCGILSDSSLLNTARCTVAAIICFQGAGLCHGDIKPGNMMLANYQNLVVTIDFGSAAGIGSPPHGGTTELYSLGDIFGTVHYDRTCLAVSLAHLKWGDDFVRSKSYKNENAFNQYVTEKEAGGSVVVDAIIKLLDRSLDMEGVWDYLSTLPFDDGHATTTLLRPDKNEN